MNKKSVSYLLMLCLLMGPAPPVHAYEEIQSKGDYFSAIGTKAGRGFWDVLSSPAEIPCTMVVHADEKGKSGYATGFGAGIFKMMRRILSGVTEVGTFFIPMERTIPPVCHEEMP